MVSLKDRCRFRKTVLIGLFCLGSLLYLCLLARVNIQNFKGSFVRQSRANLVNLARAQARHIETFFKNADQQIDLAAWRMLESGQAASETYDPTAGFDFPVEAFFVCNAEGTLPGQDSAATDSGLMQAFKASLNLKPIPQGGAIRLDPSNPDRVWMISAVDAGPAAGGYAAAAVRWDDLMQHLRIAGVTGEHSLLFADPDLRRVDPGGARAAQEMLARAARGFEGSADLGVATGTEAFEGNLIAGYCAAFLYDQSWPVAVICDDAQLQAAVKAHAEGILVAMVCLFLVLAVICISYYLSERRRLILEQQSQLSSTTTELHMVAAEKRRLSEQLRNETGFLRQVLSAVPFGMYWKDQNGQLQGQNAALGALLEESDDPAAAFRAINDEALDREVLGKGIGLMHVPQTINSGGQEQTVLVSRVPLRGADGRITGLLCGQISAACFKNLRSGCACHFLNDTCLADSWSVPTLLFGPDQTVQYANAAFEKWSGMSSEQIYRQPADRLLELSGSQCREIAQAGQSGQWMPLTVRGRRTQAFVQPVVFGNRKGVLMLLTDESVDGQTPYRAACETPADATPETVCQAKTPEILIVDDIEENRILLEMLLAKEGFAVSTCGGGREAVEMCRQGRFDLVLMDLQMPDMDGFEALRRIRQGEMNFATPVIAMTASEKRDDEVAAIECGFDDYLSKPVNQKIVRQKAWRAMQKVKQAADALEGRDIVSFLEGDPDYGRAIETFVQNLPGRLEEMKEALASRNFQSLAFKVHALKGVGGFAGFSVYTDKARRMEEAIRQQQIDDIARQMDELMDMCLRTRLKSDCS